MDKKLKLSKRDVKTIRFKLDVFERLFLGTPRKADQQVKVD